MINNNNNNSVTLPTPCNRLIGAAGQEPGRETREEAALSVRVGWVWIGSSRGPVRGTKRGRRYEHDHEAGKRDRASSEAEAGGVCFDGGGAAGDSDGWAEQSNWGVLPSSLTNSRCKFYPVLHLPSNTVPTSRPSCITR